MTNPNDPWSNPYGQQPSPPSNPYGQPAQQSSPYGQPAYGQQPPQYGQYGPPMPASNQYGASPASRPGSVTAAAVLSYVEAGFILLAGIFLIAGAKFVSDIGDSVDTDTGGATAELTIDGIVNILLGAALIAGAVMATSGRTRNVLLGACALTLADCVYWIVRAESGGKALVLIYAVLPAIALGLLLTGAASAWYAYKARTGPTGAGYPGQGQGY